MLSMRRGMFGVCLATLMVAGVGCALLDSGWETAVSMDPNRDVRLKPIAAAPRDAIEIEVIFVERPVDDPLLGDALWQEIDQIGALDPDVRSALGENGLRVGVASSSLPRALQTMLGIADPLAAAGPDSKAVAGRRLFLLPKAEKEIQASPVFSSCSVTVQKNGDSETEEYGNARFMFRVTAERLQDGWANLHFLPEIHHGEMKFRPVAGEFSWEGRSTQNIVPLHAQRFNVKLNVGELAVITADGQDPKSLGRHFFRSSDPKGSVQHVLLVRLIDISRVEPQRAE